MCMQAIIEYFAHAQKDDLRRMLSMRLNYKIMYVRPKHIKLSLFPKSATHTGLDCVKKLGDKYLMLGPLKVLKLF